MIDQVGKDEITIFSFSGHSAQSLTHPLLKDVESDGLDESLVCYDSGYKKKSEEKGRPELFKKRVYDQADLDTYALCEARLPT